MRLYALYPEDAEDCKVSDTSTYEAMFYWLKRVSANTLNKISRQLRLGKYLQVIYTFNLFLGSWSLLKILLKCD